MSTVTVRARLLAVVVLLIPSPRLFNCYKINSNDCAAILAWESLSHYMGLTSCNPAPDCSDLYGVTCSQPGRVVKLELSRIDLNGPLPPSLGNLTALRELYMDRNALTGPIPASWSNLGELHTLWMNINSITGTMPEDWGINLSKLSTLDLSRLTLRGTIPSSWSRMSLEYMVAAGNKLTGTIPSSWGDTNTLKTVDFSANQLTGTLPSSWGVLTQISLLWLDNNRLTGSIPDSWNNIPTLTNLKLNGNRLCGPPPKWKLNVGNFPPCPSPSPKSPKPPTPKTPSPRAGSPLPVSKNNRCGPLYGGTACSGGRCCSRWGWCGTSGNHCDPRRGCKAKYGRCLNIAPPPPTGLILDTDPINCGDNTRCPTGFCCNRVGKCSVLETDCRPSNGCQNLYGICYQTKDDLQFSIDSAFDGAGSPGKPFASTPSSNATLLSLYSFRYPQVCAGKPAPCRVHKAKAGQTVAVVAAMYGTNTWQLLADNPLLETGVQGVVQLRANDIVAVRPPPGGEKLRWLWSNKEALVLGRATYPRPCSGYTTQDQRMSCFCHYHQDGVYVWPFSTASSKCRQAIQCKGGKPVGRSVQNCPRTTIADDLEFNGNTQCLPQPDNFECATGDGCSSMFCFCREYLLKEGTYLNPFDSTRSTAIYCNYSEPGWYGGLVYCDGGFFDPYARRCTSVSQAQIPYKKGYTSCDGVPDPDSDPAKAAGGGRRRLQAVPWRITPAPRRPCTSKACCGNKYAKAQKYGCVPCGKYGCRDGRRAFLHIAGAARNRRCLCGIWGNCPVWFNRNCRYKKPRRS